MKQKLNYFDSYGRKISILITPEFNKNLRNRNPECVRPEVIELLKRYKSRCPKPIIKPQMLSLELMVSEKIITEILLALCKENVLEIKENEFKIRSVENV